MHLTCCGISHRTAGLEAREPFQLARGEMSGATAAFKAVADAEETAVLATCNRVEFYAVARDKTNPCDAVQKFYRQRGIDLPDALLNLFFVRHGSSAVRHLFKVTSGLDSVLIGESQIVAQVKEAYSSACSASGPGPILHKLFHQAFTASKRVRGETSLSEGAYGLAGAALEMVWNNLASSPSGLNVVLIGVNSSIETLLARLIRVTGSVTLVNRTLSKAERLTRVYGGKSVCLDALPGALADADVVFSATASKNFLIAPNSLSSRTDRPLLAIDLAAPRDIDPRIAALPGVTLFDLDDLKHYLETVSRERESEIPYALQLVEAQVATFEEWRLSSTGSDAALRELLDNDRQAILDKFRESFSAKEQKALDAFSRQLFCQFTRRTTAMLRLSSPLSKDA